MIPMIMKDHSDLNAAKAEEAVEKVIRKYGAEDSVSAADLKKWIYGSTSKNASIAMNLCLKKWLKPFGEAARPEEGNDKDAFSELIAVFQDAWNVFPHKALGGKSPNEMVEEYQRQGAGEAAAKPETLSPNGPDIICGGRRMSWDDYGAMLKEMERRQKPFKKWVEKECLPRYGSWLKRKIHPFATDKHYDVADLFFARAMHLGFISPNEMTAGFIQNDFPRWWPSHVLDSDLKPAEVRRSLGILFDFLKEYYGVKPKEYGFK